MSRVLFARRCHGGIVSQLQRSLGATRCYSGLIDGHFGPITEAAVRRHQRQRGIEASGLVDEDTWCSATGAEIPSVAERCLQLTAAFQGHEFGLVRGNHDGAWLTWGIAGFTFKQAEISLIVMEVFARHPEILHDCFGERTGELMGKLQAHRSEQEAWANRISLPPDNLQVIEPWRTAFKRFGEHEVVQAIQRRRAYEAYLEPARRSAHRYGLTSELGLALCFDIQVQWAGIDPVAAVRIETAVKGRPPANEAAMRLIVAKAIADDVTPDDADDLHTRALTIAAGSGSVHGEAFVLSHWGLGEFPAES